MIKKRTLANNTCQLHRKQEQKADHKCKYTSLDYFVLKRTSLLIYSESAEGGEGNSFPSHLVFCSLLNGFGKVFNIPTPLIELMQSIGLVETRDSSIIV